MVKIGCHKFQGKKRKENEKKRKNKRLATYQSFNDDS